MTQFINKYLVPGLIIIIVLFFSYELFIRNEISAGDLSIGERFHRDTSLSWKGVIGDLFRSRPSKPPPFKRYPGAKIVKLSRPKNTGIPLEKTIKKRRSIRNYSAKQMTLSQLSQLLFAAQGITGKIYNFPIRSAPSAGALYPYEIYVIVNNIRGISKGIYHYAPVKHHLEKIKSGNYSDEITSAGLKQDMLGDADVAFVLTAIFNRTRSKYGERGFRYVYMDAGHISQNIYLQAVSLGLGSVAVGAFLDEEVNELIDIDGFYEAAIYLHGVGTL
jgi:SagB-type dehydrogenase family enzyme